MGPLLKFYIFSNDLGDEAEHALSKFANATEQMHREQQVLVTALSAVRSQPRAQHRLTETVKFLGTLLTVPSGVAVFEECCKVMAVGCTPVGRRISTLLRDCCIGQQYPGEASG